MKEDPEEKTHFHYADNNGRAHKVGGCVKHDAPSLAHMQALTPACTTRKEIRNNPVKPITNFFPTADVKNSDHFMYVRFI